MCGIVGYIGPKDIVSVLLVGLERLSYRGYDSSGIAIIQDAELSSWKCPGKIHELQNVLHKLTIKGSIGIGHTRWATHGEPNEINAHPHLNQQNTFAIVHNGIIENYSQLKAKLFKEGYIFRSETDSEVICHLIDRYYQGNLEEAVEKATLDLSGTYAFAVICEQESDKIVVCRKDSPLIVGLGKGENYISSDLNAILSHTKNVIYLEDNEVGIIQKDKVRIKKIGGADVQKQIQHIKWDTIKQEKNGYDHFMQKEIFEQPAIIRRIISKTVKSDHTLNFKHLKMENKELVQVSRFIIQACGTSWHAGLIGKYLLEKYARVLTEVDFSSEFRYRQMITAGNEVVMAISQSGETADTLACIREAKSKFFKVLSLVNVKGSTIDRESDAVIYTHAGQEVGVASTKNFVAQLATLYLFTIYLAQLRYTISEEQVTAMVAELNRIPEYIEKILQQSKKIEILYPIVIQFHRLL